MNGTGDKHHLRIIGLMSGTSMDGIDAAMIETDGVQIFGFGPVETISYDAGFRERLRALAGHPPDGSDATVCIIRHLTLCHAKIIRVLMQRAELKTQDIDLIGFHGQTVFHAPKDGITCQIGDASLLAHETGIDVVSDFRSADVAAGGEGAPFAPVYHVALSRNLEKPLAVLNLGGVGNVTWISPDGGAIAFDTGPANALIDDWVNSRTGQACDQDGRIARAGIVRPDVLKGWLTNSYFDRLVPKSLDRDEFADLLAGLKGGSTEDGAAMLSAFTAETVARSQDHFPAAPLRWLVTGGGRHNPVIMAELRARIGVPVEPVEVVGWDGDRLEAQAFAFLAARSLFGMPLSYPQTTGVSKPVLGGQLFKAV